MHTHGTVWGSGFVLPLLCRYNKGMAKTRAGRPKKTPSERKAEYLEVRLNQAEKETFLEASKIAGLPLSTWVRERLRRSAIRELEELGREIPLFR